MLAKSDELAPTGWVGIPSWWTFHSSVGSDDGRYVHSVDPRDVGLGPVLLVLVLGVLEEDEAEAALQIDPVDGDGGGTVVGDRVGENFLHVAHDDGVAEVAEEDGSVSHSMMALMDTRQKLQGAGNINKTFVNFG